MSIKKTDILTCVSTNHLPIFFCFFKILENKGEMAYGNPTILYAAILTALLNWKIIEELIQKTILKENITDKQMVWKYTKYEIRKFLISFSK